MTAERIYVNPRFDYSDVSTGAWGTYYERPPTGQRWTDDDLIRRNRGMAALCIECGKPVGHQPHTVVHEIRRTDLHPGRPAGAVHRGCTMRNRFWQLPSQRV